MFLTPHHLAIGMEFAAGGDLSEYVQANKLPGVSSVICLEHQIPMLQWV